MKRALACVFAVAAVAASAGALDRASARPAAVGDDEVFSLQPGRAPVNLSRSKDDENDAVPSPDGSLIAFASYARFLDDTLELWTMRRDGTAQRRLSAASIGDEQGFPGIAWRPDGRALAFDVTRPCPHGGLRNCTSAEIRVVNADGTGERTVVESEGGRGDRNPSWSPDGRRIAFETEIGFDGDAHAVGVVDANGRNRRRVLTIGLEDEGPSLFSLEWSPQGERLAVRSDRGRSSRVLVRDLRSRRTFVIPKAGRFAWSPTGRLAFMRGAVLWTSRWDGRDARPLTRLRGRCDAEGLAWSPDGRSIAFFDAVRGRRFCEIQIVRVADRVRRVLTRHTAPPGFGSLAWGRRVGIVFIARSQHGDGGAPSEGVPGAFRGEGRSYEGGWRGWPVRPFNAQHPIRGSFLDPRPDGYHNGIDINVPDDLPEPDAPPGRTHRVYAVGSGVVHLPTDVRRVGCVNGRIDIDPFSYWHVDPTGIVQDGQHVEAGQWIGWTCATMWHVHLSEWATYLTGGLDRRRVWVNPLRPNGKLAPYSDTMPPTIAGIVFVRPEAGSGWRPDATGAIAFRGENTAFEPPFRLRGDVDVRAVIMDRQSFLDWLGTTHPELAAPHHPQRVRIELTRLRDRRVVLARDVFRAEALSEDGQMLMPLVSPTPFTEHYAPGTLQNIGAEPCVLGRAVLRPERTCVGRYSLHLFARPGETTWNTRLTPNGKYVLSVYAWDAMGNSTSRSVELRIAN